MTVLQPAQKPHPQSASLHFKKRRMQGVFLCILSVTCVCIGVIVGFTLQNIDQSAKNESTYWQEKATQYEAEKPIVVTYKTPEAKALKAEMDALRKSFGRYATTRTHMREQIFAGSDSGAKTIKAAEVATETAPSHQSTAKLAGKIARTLLLDEVDSFLNKVQMVEEVRQHATEVGF